MSDLLLCTIFLYRMRYFCTLTAILFCIFTLLNTVAVVLPLIFTTVKYLFWQTRFGVHSFVLKGEQSYCFLWSLRFCFVHFCFCFLRLVHFGARNFWKSRFWKIPQGGFSFLPCRVCCIKKHCGDIFQGFAKTDCKSRVAICFGLLLATTKILFTRAIGL